MLIKAIVENFKSFDERVEISMITSNKIRDNTTHRKDVKNLHLLKNAVIYGANASGKSNLIDFFSFFKFCVKEELPFNSFNSFCKLKEENKGKPSLFEIQFTIDGKFYDYGFTAILSERKITEEWLVELKMKGDAVTLFDVKDGVPKLGIKTISAEERAKFDVYAHDYSGTAKRLFLNELNQNKKYEAESKLEVVKTVYDWLTKNIIVYSPDSFITNFGYFYNVESLKTVNNLIKSFDTGISESCIVKITMEELKNKIPEPVFDDMYAELKERINKGMKGGANFSMRSYDEFFNVEVKENQEPIVTTIRLKHEKSFFDYEFKEESEGTRRLFDLIDMLLINKDDVVYIVDELERSLHPKLTQQFLQLFNAKHRDNQVQLIFTTHEASIMDQDLFRRDEIWFMERGEYNASVLYSLDAFKERYDKKLSKAYLEGRYGAIPVFKTFTFEEE